MNPQAEHKLIIPDIKILAVNKGCYWSDGWITADIELVCKTEEFPLSGFELSLWNPDSTARYAGNIVTVMLEHLEWHTAPLAMGQSVKLDLAVDVPQDCEFTLLIQSAICMQPDVLDSRERGIVIANITTLVKDMSDGIVSSTPTTKLMVHKTPSYQKINT